MTNRTADRFVLIFSSIAVTVAIVVLVILLYSFASQDPSAASTTLTAPPSTLASLPVAQATENTATSTIPTPTLQPPAPQSPTATPQPFFEGPIIYGTSVENRPLRAYRLGTGPSPRAIIGGIHGGYEWNTVHLVSQTLSFFQEQPQEVPPDVTLYIIPNANPDGYARAFDLSGRVNANDVDLNRNWNYQWQMTATHGIRPVYAGAHPFSEPETAHLRDFIQENNIELVIFYHSAMGKIFSGAERSECATFELAEMMSREIGYPHALEGVPGQITTGDAIDWLSLQGIAGIEIELMNHQDIEWDRNLQGIRAFLRWSIPDQPVTASNEGAYFYYTVQFGDTLSGISEQWGVSLEELRSINNLADEDLIYEGQRLIIPTTD